MHVDSSASADFEEHAFDAFNMRPEPERGHALSADEMYGPTPHSETGRMAWTGPRGVTGRIPTKKMYGVPTDKVPWMRTDTFNIAYTIMWPAGVTAGSAEFKRLPLMGLLHGVPMNRRAKYGIMRYLARFCICVCWDMLGMGESDSPLDYGTAEELEAVRKAVSGNRRMPDSFNAQWDWERDLPYVHQLMTDHIQIKYGYRAAGRAPRRWIFQADDWGAGIAMRYASHPVYTRWLRFMFLVNPVTLDGYFVTEIGGIAKLSGLAHRDPKAFAMAAEGLPQIIVGIEKYMVEERFRLNRYTESDYLFPYQDTRYQSGRRAFQMHSDHWAIRVLADRSSRLAPKQLQPYHETSNEEGVKTWNMRAAVVYIWGMKDQMMPPIQANRSQYLWPVSKMVEVKEIENANHFVEIDRPAAVARAMLQSMVAHLGPGAMHTPHLGVGDDLVYKGDEPELGTRVKIIA